MEELSYKEDILKTRAMGFGSSDARLLQNIVKLGYVPTSAHERMALVKGFIKPHDSYKTPEMEYGDFIENQIFAHISHNDDSYESNPCWVSKKYSRRNVKLFCHPDIVKWDEKSKTLYVYEVKATKFDVKQTKSAYRPQMYIEWLIANEMTLQRGKTWHTKFFLVHYDTNGEDISQYSFNPQKLTLHQMAFSAVFDVAKAMDIANSFLDDFNEYYTPDEVDSEYLPANVQEQFTAVTNMLLEIKEREIKVNEFKEKLFKFMQEKGVKSIKNDAWAITRVDAVESVTFNAKAFLDDYKKQHPLKAKKLIQQYEKRVARKGYVNIKLK